MTTAKEFRFPEVNMMMMRQNPMGMMQQQPPPMPHRNVMVVTSSSAEKDIAAGEHTVALEGSTLDPRVSHITAVA